MTVATREKCPCCDFDSDGFGKNIIGKGYGSCEIRLYTPKKTSQYEDLVRYTAINSFDGCFDNDEPVDVKIVAYFPVPKSWSKKRKALCLANKELPIKMPDADNIGKIIMDGMNPKRKLNKQLRKMVEVMQGVYKDDRQVTKLLVVKRYAERPRVEVRIKRDMGD